MENTNNSVNSVQTSNIYKFGDCYLDSIGRKIFRGKNMLKVSHKAFDMLLLLIENSGKVISKDEILEKIWEDSFVEECNLAVHISKIRKLLGANKAEPFIETVPGSGYRFVSRVYTLDENDWKEYLAANFPVKISNEQADFDSIAVLPLKNENGNEEIDYLADGLTESIINNLSYIPKLKVLARNTVFRYKDKNVDIQEVGKKLDVAKILTGRIRVIRDNLIIGIELTDVENGTQLWGTQLNQPFEDIFEIQETITQAVSEKLKSHINNSKMNSLIPQLTQNAESYRLYLKGKYLLDKKSLIGINKAIECFHQSISQDPTNAHSYVVLADSYRLLYSYEQISRENALNQIYPLLTKAAELNPLNSELYVFKGIINMFLEFDIYESEKNLKKALKLNSNSVNAHYRYAELLVYSGRFSESLNHIKEYTKLDPISLRSNKNSAILFYCMEQYETSLLKLEECLELEPEDFETHLFLGINLTEIGEYDKALQAYQKSLFLQYYSETILMIGYTNALSGNVEEAQKNLNQLKELSKKNHISPLNFGIIYVALGKTEEAFECLEKTFQEHFTDLIALKSDPRWKRVRQDPRFNEMLYKIGLPVD